MEASCRGLGASDLTGLGNEEDMSNSAFAKGDDDSIYNVSLHAYWHRASALTLPRCLTPGLPCHRTFTSGCTTSPPRTLNNFAPSELEEIIEIVQESWAKFPYPTFPCPADVLIVLIRINHLRSAFPEAGADITITPEHLLCRLEELSPEAWGAAMPTFHDEWLAIATAYHSAVIIYCISSFEHYFSLSSRQGVEVQRSLVPARLFSSLQQFEASVAMRSSVV